MNDEIYELVTELFKLLTQKCFARFFLLLLQLRLLLLVHAAHQTIAPLRHVSVKPSALKESARTSFPPRKALVEQVANATLPVLALSLCNLWLVLVVLYTLCIAHIL